MSKLKIISLNANGMGNLVKRKVIFSKLKEQRADICLLQETHSSPQTGFLWAREWGGQVFYSHGSSGSRGVAILLNTNSDIKVLSNSGDEDGRIVAMNIKFQDTTLTIASVYSPTQDKPTD